MFEKMFIWTGQKAALLIAGLAVVVSANVLFQAYTHKTTPLLAWKGGGFGMYTEPHVEDRSVWIILKGAEGAANVRVWPETPEFSAWRDLASLRGTNFLNQITTSAENVRYYPRDNQADALINLAARVGWHDSVIGDVVPAEGKVFKRKDISVVVYENRYDVSGQRVIRSAIFELNGGGQS